MKQNITLSLEKDIIHKARVIAAKRATSVSQMLSDELRRIVDANVQYEQACQQALADLDKGLRLGGTAATREALHER
ncbi:MAG: DUF6364 family protein [Thiogranum sp.]